MKSRLNESISSLVIFEISCHFSLIFFTTSLGAIHIVSISCKNNLKVYGASIQQKSLSEISVLFLVIIPFSSTVISVESLLKSSNIFFALLTIAINPLLLEI